MQTTSDKIKEIIAKVLNHVGEGKQYERTGCLKVTKQELTEEKNFSRDLGGDSLDTTILILSLEEGFHIEEIPESEAEKLKTVGDIIAYITRKCKCSIGTICHN